MLSRNYTSHVQALCFLVSEFLFPYQLSFFHVQILCMTSKRVRNKLDGMKQIMDSIRTSLGSPRSPSLLTFIRSRSPFSDSDSMRGFRTEILLACRYSCSFCLNHTYRSSTDDKTGSHIFSNWIEACPTCSSPASTYLQRRSCNHFSHGPSFQLEKRVAHFPTENSVVLTPLSPFCSYTKEGILSHMKEFPSARLLVQCCHACAKKYPSSAP